MLELAGISFSYGPKNILKGIDLSVNAGEMLVVLGPNGAGKSTLLRIAGGSLAPGSGSVKIAGNPIGAYSPKALARIRAFLEQDSSVAFDCRVLDAVLLGRYAHGNFSAGPDDLGHALLALEEVGLAGFGDRFFMSLSGGEKRRVMLARVLAQLAGRRAGESALLILDEPSSGLDPSHAHGALSAARKLADGGAAVLAVLHDPNLAAQYAERLAFMKSGRLLAVRGSESAMDAALLEETYGSRCKIVSDPSGRYAVFLR